MCACVWWQFWVLNKIRQYKSWFSPCKSSNLWPAAAPTTCCSDLGYLFCSGAAQRYEVFQPIRQTLVPGYKHLWGTAAKWLWIWPQTQRVRGSNTSTIPPDSREEAQRRFHVAAVDPLCSLGARLRHVCKHAAAAVYTVCTACIGLSSWKIYTQIKIKQKLQQRNGAESQ